MMACSTLFYAVSLMVMAATAFAQEGASLGTEAGHLALPRVSWRQTAGDLSLTFDASGYESFFYNTTTQNEKSVVRLMFQNGTEQQFLRLHLAAAVVPDATTAEAEEGGARLNLKKQVQGSFWDQAILFATPTPLVASVDVMMPDEKLQKVQATEFSEMPEAVRGALRQAGLPLDVNFEAGIAGIASTLSEAITKAVPECHQELFCTCSRPLLFNGGECIDGSSWFSQPVHITSSSDLPFPGREGEFLTSQQLVDLSEDDFVTVFENFRSLARPATWPSNTYAQSFAGRRVLVAGAGLSSYETLVLAQLGAQLTYVDSDMANLRLLDRLVGLTRVPSGNVQALHATSRDSFNALPSDYDAIIAIDSLNNAPSEVATIEYQALLQRLRVGGRWIQTAPSKARYVATGRPNLNGGFRPYESAAPIPKWADWLDLPKVMELFPRASFELVLRHQNDMSFFIDLRLESKAPLVNGAGISA